MRYVMPKLASALVLSAGLALAASAQARAAEGGHIEIERQPWTFSGFTGQYDKQQLQRGFKIYEKVCANCHGLKRVYFRNLVEPGGPEFPEESVKALAAAWPNQIPQLNDAGESAVTVKDKDGKVTGFEYVKKPPKLSDPILGPYANDAAARDAQNGALPPDLSLIVKARNVEYNGSWWYHPFKMLFSDVLAGYQEGGADYLYALLTGYKDAPAGVTVAEGMYYNAAFPGHQLAMPPPISPEALVDYEEGAGAKASVEQNSRDLTAFLAWASDPTLNQRKSIGWQVMLYLLVTTVLLYFAKKRVWSKIPH